MNDAALRTEILALAASAANANESLSLRDFAQLDAADRCPMGTTKRLVGELVAEGKIERRGSRYFLAL